METDSFFYQVLKQLPERRSFGLLGQPLTDVADYRSSTRWKSAEIVSPGRTVRARTRSDLPVAALAARSAVSASAKRSTPNLFAKVFSYLEANDPEQEWMAVALFPQSGCRAETRRSLRRPARVARACGGSIWSELTISGRSAAGTGDFATGHGRPERNARAGNAPAAAGAVKSRIANGPTSS